MAAGGNGPVRIFARDALTKELGTSTFTGTIGVAWAPGDALLAAVRIAVRSTTTTGARRFRETAAAFGDMQPVAVDAIGFGKVRGDLGV